MRRTTLYQAIIYGLRMPLWAQPVCQLATMNPDGLIKVSPVVNIPIWRPTHDTAQHWFSLWLTP